MAENIVHFISYGDDKYTLAKERIKKQANKTKWFKSVNIYGREHISEPFSKEFEDILSKKVGGGCWMWKFDFILRHLKNMSNNEFLVYIDCGCSINHKARKRFDEYLEILKTTDKTKIISFQMSHLPEKNWTLKEVFKACDVSLDNEIANSGQCVGGILIMQKSDDVVKLFETCLEIIRKDHNIITDYYKNKKQNECFKDCRYDQSILSVIRKLMNCVIIEDETYYRHFSCDEAKRIPFLATRLRKK